MRGNKILSPMGGLAVEHTEYNKEWVRIERRILPSGMRLSCYGFHRKTLLDKKNPNQLLVEGGQCQQ